MTYSYDVSYEEKQVILECYERILCKIVFYLKSLQNQNVFEDFFSVFFCFLMAFYVLLIHLLLIINLNMFFFEIFHIIYIH